MTLFPVMLRGRHSPTRWIDTVIDSKTRRHFDDSTEDLTNELMKHILRNVRKADDSMEFTCPIGSGAVYMQRVRMQISRARKKFAAQGEVVARFILQTAITHDLVNRADVVRVTRKVTEAGDLTQFVDMELIRQTNKE